MEPRDEKRIHSVEEVGNDPVAAPLSVDKHLWKIPLLILWVVSPALIMVMSVPAGNSGGSRSSQAAGGFFLLGLLGGPIALFIWSYVVLPKTWDAISRFFLAIPMTLVLCAVNLALAGAGCVWLGFRLDMR